LVEIRDSADTDFVSRLSYARKVGAGRTANDEYQRRYTVWRGRVRKYVLAAAVSIAALELIARTLWPAHGAFYLGLALGLGVSFYVVALENPPEHIDRWRRGRDGERRTARALRPLTRHGWTVVHDLDSEYGNLDHVVVGPSGVFLLDSKNLGGEVSVEGGVLRVRWLEDPDDGYESPGLSRRMRASAAGLNRRLAGEVRWVDPVVVIWGRFEQGIVQADRVAFVHGEQLAGWLAARTQSLNADVQRRSAAAVKTL
jgi:nuclease-like protein